MQYPMAIKLSACSLSSELLKRLQLDVRVSEPYYLQLRRQIEALVRSGALPVGSHMPSERDLAELLNISRMTIRRCYDELRHARILHTRGRRLGTVVAAPNGEAPTRPRSTLVLERAIVWDGTVASRFNRMGEGEFLRLARLRLAGGLPVAREVAWYDLSLAPQMALWPGDGSAYVFLREHCNLVPAWATQSVDEVTSSGEDAQALGLAAPAACLLLKRQTFVAGGQQVEYAERIFPRPAQDGQPMPEQDWEETSSFFPSLM